MDFITSLSQYMMENSGELLSLTLEHLLMVAYGIGLALLVGIPLGIIAAKYERIAPIILSATSILQLNPKSGDVSDSYALFWTRFSNNGNWFVFLFSYANCTQYVCGD